MNNNKFLIEMGNRISKRRKELCLTQEQVAENMSLSLQSISCIELGKKAIKPENLYNLCKVLNVNVDYILSGKKSKEQLEGIIAKISKLSDSEISLLENLIDHFLNSD